MQFYLDTSIWRDYYENRYDRFRPLGEWAFEFFRYCKTNKCVILYSDLIIHELGIKYDLEQIQDILMVVDTKGLLEKVEISDEEISKAIELSRKFNIPKNDALHALLAKNNHAVLIARDRHFYELTGFVEIQKPEDII